MLDTKTRLPKLTLDEDIVRTFESKKRSISSPIAPGNGSRKLLAITALRLFIPN